MLSTFEFSDNIVGIIVKNDIHSETLEEIHQRIEEQMDPHGKISLFFELEQGNHISFMSVLKDLKFKVEHMGRFRKIAIVTDVAWFNKVIVLKDIIMDCDVKIFESKDRMVAINWISQ